MPFTQADVDALHAILVSGAGRVKHGDREVTYRNGSEIMAAIAAAEAEVAASSATPPQRMSRVVHVRY